MKAGEDPLRRRPNVSASDASRNLDLALRAAEHALAEATPEHWLRRADEFDAARPQLRLHPPATRDAVSRHHRLGELARACRAHATLVAPTSDLVDDVRHLATQLVDQLHTEIADLLEQMHTTVTQSGRPDVQRHRLDVIATLVDRLHATAARALAAAAIPTQQPPTAEHTTEGSEELLARHRPVLAALDQPPVPTRGVA